ncbi:MAG: hypothetical protein HC936_18850 [Leptolyngbyaceae cyanobacterium SU_3_3]|nr:hypothetical protein [Leptolyngbyaceae cyanobacterium SU_3_3]
MAIHTALMFVILSIGILGIKSDRGFMQTITGQWDGAMVARRFLPAAIVFPFLIGWLIIQGWRVGYYDPAFAMSLLVSVLVIASIIFIWKTSASLNRSDAKRRHAETIVRESEQRFRSL